MLLWIDHRWVEEIDGGVGAEEECACILAIWRQLIRLAGLASQARCQKNYRRSQKLSA
jgi:hypothetical protein